MESFEKVVLPGFTADGHLFCKIEWDGERLSISGVEGPTPGGNCRGSCGQVASRLPNLEQLFAGWDRDLVRRFAEVWERWHLNDMRAGCEHQRAEGWGQEQVEVVRYGLTSLAYYAREAAIKHGARAAALGEDAHQSETDRALVLLDDWYADRYAPPDPKGPLAGCYEVKARKTELATWVRPDQHPRGVLGKACPTCGYKYGTAWLREEVPEDVLEFLRGLPDATVRPAWV